MKVDMSQLFQCMPLDPGCPANQHHLRSWQPPVGFSFCRKDAGSRKPLWLLTSFWTNNTNGKSTICRSMHFLIEKGVISYSYSILSISAECVFCIFCISSVLRKSWIFGVQPWSWMEGIRLVSSTSSR